MIQLTGGQIMGKEIGIDFGTTNTVISYMTNSGHIATMYFTANQRRDVIPTVMYFKSKDEVLIGLTAKNKGIVHPRACVKNFKTFLGNTRYKYHVVAENGDTFHLTAQKATSIFLSKILYNAQKTISSEFADTLELATIDKVIISVPAKFEDNKIRALKEAAKEAALRRVELIPEPTAAAIAYIKEHNIKENENILVYDFGGGTFDIAVLEKKGDNFSSPHTDGDVSLGGNDITMRIVEDVIKRVNSDFNIEMPSKMKDYDEEYCKIDKELFIKNYNEIFRVCNDDIKHLYGNNADDFTGDIEIFIGRKPDGSPKSKRFEYSYNIQDIEKLIEKDINRTIECTKDAIMREYEHNVKIGKIILAGGSSNLPVIKTKLDKMIATLTEEIMEQHKNDEEYMIPDADKMIRNRLGKMEVIMGENLSTLISKGDAYMANESFNIKYFPFTTSALGIKIKDTNRGIFALFKPIIHEGTALPCNVKEEFTILDLKDNCMKIEIYEADERKFKGRVITIGSKGVRKKDTLVVKNVPNDVNMTLEVTFSIQADKTIIINADIKSGDRIISANHKIERDSNLL